ncbi:MAG: glucosyl-3-phosphoglycerate synthase [Methanobacteriota archaeon]
MDQFQTHVTTVHDFSMDERRLRKKLLEHVQERPACVLLPMVYDEMKRPALEGIRDGLSRCDFLNEVVLSLTARNEREHREVARFFSSLPMPVRVVWCESPKVRRLFADTEEAGLELSRYEGKGIAVWIGFGLAASENYAVLCHDADIETYAPKLPMSLLLPIVDPALDFFVSKGYYARITEEVMYGRVVRLFVWPFLDSLAAVLGVRSSFLRYLRAFRYPLSGEFAITTDLSHNIRIPTDWGLELGVLAEVYRNAAQKRICQVDLGLYSHKHKGLGKSTEEGLLRMVHNIVVTVLRTMTENEGTPFSEATLHAIQVRYRRTAQDYVRRYYVEAEMNGLRYDRHAEESTIEAFARALARGSADFPRNPTAALVPDWLRVRSATERLPAGLDEAAIHVGERRTK